jgi:1-deoxy-D-xylulose 5-phosphate reductoisomerase
MSLDRSKHVVLYNKYNLVVFGQMLIKFFYAIYNLVTVNSNHCFVCTASRYLNTL